MGGSGDKPAWAVLSGLYHDGALSCPPVAPPVLALLSDKSAVAAGEPLTLTWSAADVDSLSIDGGVGPVKGSLGSVMVAAPAAGPVRYTLTGTNHRGGAMATETASVDIAISP